VGFFDRLIGLGPEPKLTIYLNGGKGGEHEIGVVGTTCYQEAAERVVKRNREKDGRIKFTATLVPEPNPNDPNAIAVYGEGRQIGYLSREDAARYCSALARLAESYTVATPGTIYAGHRGGSSWGIGLRLPPPEQI
jgi:HIRAN domain